MYDKGAMRVLRRLCYKHRIYVYAAVWYSIHDQKWVVVFGGLYSPKPSNRELRRIKGAVPEIKARISRALVAGNAKKFNRLEITLDF